jgi:beta-lactamase superfamily II metal-dependent hydrolase
MAPRYVSKSKARFIGDDGETMYLIFGEEVEHLSESGDASTVKYRGRTGSVSTAALAGDPTLECYFLDVGQGDSTLIVTPGRKRILIDGGKSPARGRAGQAEQSLTWMYRLDEVDEPVVIDLLVITHADEDHIGGLVNLVLNRLITVKRVVHSGIATYDAPNPDDDLGVRDGDLLITTHDSLDDLDAPSQHPLSKQFLAWKTALELEGVEYGRVQAGGEIDVGDPAVTIRVLGPIPDELPSGEVALEWLGDKSHTINGHSVVMSLEYKNARVLLPGDVNKEGSARLLADAWSAQHLDAHVLKAPHHGSHEFAPEFLEAVRPQVTSISSGEIPDHGHPRANFLGAVGKYSRSDEPLLFSTALSALFGAAGWDEEQAVVDANADSTSEENAVRRELFRRLLPGIINVRTDGEELFAATRVQAQYWWATFGPTPLAARPNSD